MARVILMRGLARRFADGVVEHEVPGLKIRDLVRELDRRFPGIGAHLEEGVAVAIDGEIHQNALFSTCEPNSEVAFMPPLEGG